MSETEPPGRPAASSASGRPRRRMAPDDRRQALIKVALDLFNTRPYGDVSVDEIAEVAGVSRPLLYHYYGGKYGVFLAALGHAADELITVVVEASRNAPRDWLLAGLRAYLDYVERNPIGFGALVRHGAGPGEGEDQAILDGVRDKLLRLIVDALAVPEPPPALRTAIRGWIAQVEVSCRDWLPGAKPVKADLYLLDLFGGVLVTAARHDEQVRRALRSSQTGLEGSGVSLL
ncbi:TetR/AcrR family transcriptional regulator [Catenulispora subtropica]|uniref:TetR/AcrR family transcriptional regulator n=1 Tax=Catenulispora subtropica TaxID=450798 RepID=UPI0031D46428